MLDNGPIQQDTIQLVQSLLQNAIETHVSDIHIEAHTQEYRVRYRRDGLLYDAMSLPFETGERVITRFKVISDLNIAEHRLPQDGRIDGPTDNLDIRISICPTLHGEKVVLRLLNRNKIQLDISGLGLLPGQETLFLEKLAQPNGLILVSGPTGSGKTVTLYSALNYLNRTDKNIVTVEDPVEMDLSSINQVNINPQINLNFPTVLRAFLRQDPDILMIGEIRDFETANIALQAALTGHLVLTTLHTNHAAEVLFRLQTMGLATYQIIHAVKLIMSQRLLRKLCVYCKKEIPTPKTLANLTLPPSLYIPQGCQHCQQGYNGRMAIFELINMTETIMQMLLNNRNIIDITQQARHDGMISLWEVGLEKVCAGATSFAELIRVLGYAEKNIKA